MIWFLIENREALKERCSKDLVYIIDTYLDFFHSWLGIFVDFHRGVMQGAYLHRAYCTSYAQIYTDQVAVDPEQKNGENNGFYNEKQEFPAKRSQAFVHNWDGNSTQKYTINIYMYSTVLIERELD